MARKKRMNWLNSYAFTLLSEFIAQYRGYIYFVDDINGAFFSRDFR